MHGIDDSASELKEDGRLLRGEATREKVLNAAERLFGEHGFDGVSIRQIAKEAGVTLGVVGFHGGAKFDLFQTVLRRRVNKLTAERDRRLADLQSGDAPPTLKALMDAYISPYVEVASADDPQWRAYARLIATCVSDDRWYPSVGELYDPMARKYLAAIAALHPDIDRDKLATAFVLSVAAMLSIVASRIRIAALSERNGRDGRAPAAALAYRDVLVDFCAGGIEAAILSERD